MLKKHLEDELKQYDRDVNLKAKKSVLSMLSYYDREIKLAEKSKHLDDNDPELVRHRDMKKLMLDLLKNL